MRAKCVVCGKAVTKSMRVRGVPIHFDGCRDLFVAELQGYFTIAGFSKQDLVDNELITTEESDKITPEQEKSLAQEVGERFWDDYMGSCYNEALPVAVALLERMKINGTAPKDLPKLLGTIKDKDNQKLLEGRLKGE